MDQNFRKRLRKTLYCGDLEPEHNPLILTEMATEYYGELNPDDADQIDLESASTITSQETVSPTSVVMSMMYAKRLRQKRPDYTRKLSSSDLFIISVMMASKYLYDEGVDEEVFNDEWADNNGLDKEQINKMELDFLDALDWELFIGKEDFEQTMLSIEKSIAMRQGLQRGWFSYTDLCLLLDDMWLQLSESGVGLRWWKMIVISSAMYTVGALALVSSAVLVTHLSLAVASLSLQANPIYIKTPADVLPTTLSVPPMVHIAEEFSQSSDAGSVKGKTDQTTDEASKSIQGNKFDSPSDKEKQPGTDENGMVDKVLSQLKAVLSLKSQLVQFVTAVSDGYTSGTNSNNSARKMAFSYISQCTTSSKENDCINGQGMGNTGADSIPVDIMGCPANRDMKWKCLYCRRQFLNSRCYNEPISGVKCPSWLPHYCRGLGNEWSCLPKGQGLADCWKHQGIGRTQKHWHGHSQVATSYSDRQYVEALITLQTQFPDITVGFSTSMPLHVFDT